MTSNVEGLLPKFFSTLMSWVSTLFGFEFYASFFGEVLHCFWKGQPFVVHDESEDVATFLATKAFEGLRILKDRKRRRFFLVKRAAGDKVSTTSLELDIRPNQIDDVDSGFDESDIVTHLQGGGNDRIRCSGV